MTNATAAGRTLRVPFLDLKLQMKNLGVELKDAIWATLESTAYIQGKAVAEFEKAFAQYCGSREAVALDSGTAALHLALLALAAWVTLKVRPEPSCMN